MPTFDDPDYRSPRHRRTVRAAHAAFVLFGRAYHRLRVAAPPTIPRRGPAILVCNHVSGLDPPLLQSALARPVVWMMAQEFYDVPAMRPFFQLLDAIPVARGDARSESAATRAALRALDAGRVLAVFPEGRIEPADDLLPFQPGVAMLARRAAAPVHPAYLTGTMRRTPMLRAFLLPQDAVVAFGPPLAPPARREDLGDATARIVAAVERLRTVVERSRPASAAAESRASPGQTFP